MWSKFTRSNSLKQIRNVTLFIAVLTWLCQAQSVLAKDFKKPLHFAIGKNSATVTGDMVRGDRDIYLIKVNAGQTMSVNVSALEENAVFSVFEPNAKHAIPGTEEGKDLTKWQGSLSKTGEYRIIVGGTRGNASYTMQVTVK